MLLNQRQEKNKKNFLWLLSKKKIKMYNKNLFKKNKDLFLNSKDQILFRKKDIQKEKWDIFLQKEVKEWDIIQIFTKCKS